MNSKVRDVAKRREEKAHAKNMAKGKSVDGTVDFTAGAQGKGKSKGKSFDFKGKSGGKF